MATAIQSSLYIPKLINNSSDKENTIKDALRNFNTLSEEDKDKFIDQLTENPKLTKATYILAQLINIFLENTSQEDPSQRNIMLNKLNTMLEHTPKGIKDAFDNCERVNIDQHFRISGSGFNLSGNTYIISGLLGFTYQLIEENNNQQIQQNTIESDDEDETKDSDKIIIYNNSPRIPTMRQVDIMGIQNNRVIAGINYLAEAGNPNKQEKIEELFIIITDSLTLNQKTGNVDTKLLDFFFEEYSIMKSLGNNKTSLDLLSKKLLNFIDGVNNSEEYYLQISSKAASDFKNQRVITEKSDLFHGHGFSKNPYNHNELNELCDKQIEKFKQKFPVLTLEQIIQYSELIMSYSSKKRHQVIKSAIQPIINMRHGHRNYDTVSNLMLALKNKNTDLFKEMMTLLVEKIPGEYNVVVTEITAMILNDWVNHAPQDERDARIRASNNIKTCIANGSEILGLSGLGLTELPPFNLLNVLSHIKILNLSKNQLTQINAYTFAWLPNLTHLSLSRNQLTQIHVDTFAGLHSLKELHLSGNRLTQIDRDAFAGLRLIYLDLSGNELPPIDEYTFAGLPEFTRIDFSHNRGINTENVMSNNSTEMILNNWVNHAPQGERAARIQASDKIKTCIANRSETLDLSGLGLTELPPFNLSRNQLTQINSNTFEGLTNLINLVLSSNRLAQIDPNAFAGLINLSWLDLYGNQLTQINTDTFGGLPNLRDLSLAYNRLAQIDPNTFAGWTRLEGLNLSSNQLTQINSNAFEGLTNLIDLVLSSNRLAQIDPNAFAGLINLSWLDLYGNQLTQINTDTFGGLPNLRDLSLAYNRLAQIDPNTFAGWTRLEGLNLSSNQLTQINSNAFEGLTNLTNLLIFNNQLIQIGNNAFAGLINLQLLNLCVNQLTQIHADTFAGLPNLKLLNLSRNYLPPIDRNTFTGLSESTRIDFSPQMIQSATTPTTLINQHLQKIYVNANMPTPTLLLHKIGSEQLKTVELFFQKLTFNNHHSDSMRTLLTKVISMMNHMLATQNEENNIALTNCFNLMLAYAQNCGDAAGLGLIEVWLTLSKSNNSSTTTNYYNITKTSLILSRVEAFTNEYYPYNPVTKENRENIEIMINLLLRLKEESFVHIEIENGDMQYSHFGNIVTDAQYRKLAESLKEEVNDELICKEMATIPGIISRFSDKFSEIEAKRATEFANLEAKMDGAEIKDDVEAEMDGAEIKDDVEAKIYGAKTQEDKYSNQVLIMDLECNNAKAKLMRDQIDLEHKLRSLVTELNTDNSSTGNEFKKLYEDIKTADFNNKSDTDARKQDIQLIKMRSSDLTNAITQNYLELQILITETTQKLQCLVDVHNQDQTMFDSLSTMVTQRAKFSFVADDTNVGNPSRLLYEINQGNDKHKIHENLRNQQAEIESVSNELQQQELQLKQMSEYNEIYNSINTTIQGLIF